MFRAGGAAGDRGVELFAFARRDGVGLSPRSWRRAASSTGAEADTVDFGAQTEVAVTLDGGAGDDLLAGGRGNTTYVFFSRGSGRDTIVEGADWAGSTDLLRLGAGLTPTDDVW